MRQSEFIYKLNRKLPSLNPQQIQRMISTIWGSVLEDTIAGGKTVLRGFGTFNFKTVVLANRKDPRTQKSLGYKVSKSISFKPSKNQIKLLKEKAK